MIQMFHIVVFICRFVAYNFNTLNNMKKSDESSALEGLVTLLIGIPLSVLLTLYSVFTIMKLVEWFKVPLSLTQAQWFGALAIIAVIRFKTDSKKSNDPFVDMVTTNIVVALALSLILGIYYVLHFIIN